MSAEITTTTKPRRATRRLVPGVEKRWQPLAQWCTENGWSRTKTYEWLNDGRLRAKKNGRLTIIDCEHANRVIAALPDYAPGNAVAIVKNQETTTK
jgi:hypothetical protein